MGDQGPSGPLGVPSGGDGVWEIRRAGGRPCLAPNDSSHYVYFTLPTGALPDSARRPLARDRVLRRAATPSSASSTPRRTAPPRCDGLYKAAEQRWDGDGAGLERFRRALFPLPDFDPARPTEPGCRPSASSSGARSSSPASILTTEPPTISAASRHWPHCRSFGRCPDGSTPSTTSSSRSPTPATSSARGAPTPSWIGAGASWPRRRSSASSTRSPRRSRGSVPSTR